MFNFGKTPNVSFASEEPKTQEPVAEEPKGNPVVTQLKEMNTVLDTILGDPEVLPELTKFVEKIQPFSDLVMKSILHGHTLDSLTVVNTATQLCKALIEKGEKSEGMAEQAVAMAKKIVALAKE